MPGLASRQMLPSRNRSSLMVVSISLTPKQSAVSGDNIWYLSSKALSKGSTVMEEVAKVLLVRLDWAGKNGGGFVEAKENR